MEIATWIGIGVLTIINIAGWILTSNRYSKENSTDISGSIGRLCGKVDGIDKRMESLETRMENLESRIDGLFSRE